MPISFDYWRSQYDYYSLDDQRRISEDLYRNFPDQEHHHADAVAALVRRVKPKSVVEVGGWRGELAAKILRESPGIESWLNLEICDSAVRDSIVTDPRYRAVVQEDWVWADPLPESDLFVAAHMIEHIKAKHLEALVGQIRSKHLYIEAPLLEEGQSWDGYGGTHILEIGWDAVHKMMADRGYEILNFVKLGDTGIAAYSMGS